MLLADLREKRVRNKTVGELFLGFLVILAIIFLFIFSLEFISTSFRQLGKDFAGSIIAATSNPFIGLFIGLLSTAVLQSSSTTTAIVVAIVSSGSLSLQSAVPMVMGANIGTTVTSTIVSMGHITKRKEFRKAITAATLHDFFNIWVALVLFPIEYFTGWLSGAASLVTTYLFSFLADSQPDVSIFDYKQGPISKWVVGFTRSYPLWVLILSVLSLILAIKGFTTFIRAYFVDNSLYRLETWVFRNNGTSLAWGTVLTALIQSSSVTSSLIVPMVATGKVKLGRAFYFLMGANIGTTLTALLAAISKSEAAVSLAITHLLFNLIGVSMMFIPFIKQIPVRCAKELGHATNRYRIIGFLYLVVIFFLAPFLLIYFTR